jgi:hypothetical protein
LSDHEFSIHPETVMLEAYDPKSGESVITAEADQQSSVVPLQRGFRWVLAAFALLSAYLTRFKMNPDGVSYLDLGDQYWRGNWHVALNPYWSPLYSWLTGFMLLLTKPGMRWEYPAVYLLNFGIFIAAMFCFEFFWKELLAWREDEAVSDASRPYVWALGYLLFAYTHLVMQELEVTPDLLVAAVVYLVSGMMLRFSATRMTASFAVLLGMILGVGYLAKTAMMPFALIVLVTMMVAVWRKRWKGLRLVAATALGLVIVSAPFIAAISGNNHRFTIGDSGKINVGWMVNHETPVHRHWQGDGPGHPSPPHPTRKLSTWPEIYEFATPVIGTYPVWYDPSYWNAGIDSHVHLWREIGALKLGLSDYVGYLILRTEPATAVLLLLLMLSDDVRKARQKFLGFWPILVPATFVLLMYAMVWWELRYTCAQFVVIWAAVVASTMIAEPKWRIRVFRASSLILGGIVLTALLHLDVLNYRERGKSAVYVTVAEQLRSQGLVPGDHVAVIGDAFDAEYWARLDRVRIVAEMPETLETGNSAAAFWSSSPDGQQKTLAILKNTGAKAVVAEVTPNSLPPQWIPLGNTRRAVYLF